jgi:hypothetical protein
VLRGHSGLEALGGGLFEEMVQTPLGNCSINTHERSLPVMIVPNGERKGNNSVCSDKMPLCTGADGRQAILIYSMGANRLDVTPTPDINEKRRNSRNERFSDSV